MSFFEDLGTKMLPDIIDGMKDMGAAKVAMTLCKKDGRAVAAVILLQGNDTQAYLDAIEKKEAELEDE